MKEMVGGCCVCSDERGWDENPLVYCDGQGCTVAVHQACYGIVTVPSGPWFCRKCESQERSARVRCELCPSRDGALKRTDSNGWAHVVCALYIPEVRFGNVTTMEPILISLIPSERFNKSCYICEESTRGSKASAGACMQCNKPGCKQNFHVTCAQMLGLLCEEAGNMMDNVKYCGYCQYHYGKLKKTSNMKIIPPFRPIPNSPQLGNNGSEPCPLVVLNKEHISPDVNKSTTLKKKVSGGSSSSSSSSKNSSNIQSGSTPRIAPSNLFSTNTFSNSVTKSSERNDSSSSSELHKSVEDSFVLKSEDLKMNNNTNACNGDSNKFLKSSDFMTVKLNDVLTASLDRPIHDSNHRDKSQPPDIKPHVTLTPIPMRSTDKDRLQEKASILFGQQSGQTMPKLKDSSQISASQEGDKSLADISTTLFTGDNKLAISSSKRTREAQLYPETLTPDNKVPVESESSLRARPAIVHKYLLRFGRISMDFDSPTADAPPTLAPNSESSRIVNTDYGIPPSTWDINKQPGHATISRTNSDDRSVVLASPNNPGSSEDVNNSPVDNSLTPSQTQLPLKRGPGRPVKRKAVVDREDERIDDQQRKKTKRGGRRGGNGGQYNHREDFSELSASLIDDNATDNTKKVSGAGRKPGQTPKKVEDPPAPTLSQLKAQMEANKSEAVPPVLPAHMFGNALNPASSMAQRMVDTLSQEMETIAAAGAGCDEKVEKSSDKLVGIPIPKPSSAAPVVNPAPKSGPTPTNPPQTLEQLLERQWEQGSQFLMEQAQHLDIAQLLSCLNQLKQDNRALEEHVASLIQRKEQLTAINARLSIPLGSSLSISGTITGPNNSMDDRVQENSGSQQQRSNQATAEVVNPQQHGTSRPFTGLPVPVVVTAHPHPSPHTHPGHGSR